MILTAVNFPEKSFAMRTTPRVSIFLLVALAAAGPALPMGAAPVRVDTQNVLLSVDATNGRWSAEIKGTPMQLNEVYFLPGDDARSLAKMKAAA